MKKTTQKAITLPLSVILLLTALPCQVFAADALTSEQITGGNYTYIVENGEATIIRGNIQETHIEILAELGGHPVTAIGEYAFAYGYKIVAIYLPESLKKIEKEAFNRGRDIDVYYAGTATEWNKVDVDSSNSVTKNDDSNLSCNAIMHYVGDKKTPLLRGDINADGRLNSTDALAVLKYSVGSDTNLDISRADANGDSTINSTDALLILQVSVGSEGEILYYYTDGTTGYTPKPGAEYYSNGCWNIVSWGNSVSDEEIKEAHKNDSTDPWY